MKVICKECGKLVEEKQAIKMNEVEFRQRNGKPFQFFNEDYGHYTQICIKCFKGKK